jgi:hypothetical protein
MSFPKKLCDDGELVDLGRKRGSSGGESSNKQVNQSGKDATRLLPETSHQKIVLRVTRLNSDKDVAVEHLTGVKPKKPMWFVHEAMDQRASTCEYLQSSSATYPPKLKSFKYPGGYSEPTGLGYSRMQNWQQIDRQLYYHGADKSISRVVTLAQPLQQEEVRREIPTNDVGTPSHFSSGASTWNRHEGGLARTPPNKLLVVEPLTSIQETILAEICSKLQDTHSNKLQSIPSFVAAVRHMWDTEHFQRLARNESGLGGVLPTAIATSRINTMCNMAIASRHGPETYTPLFLGTPSLGPLYFYPPMTQRRLPEQPEQQGRFNLIVPIAPRPMSPQAIANQQALLASTATKTKRGRPPKVSQKPTPLYSLTIKEANNVTTRQMREYVYQINGARPANSEQNKETVLAFIQERNRSKRKKASDST